jgi:cysteine synthase A
VARSNHVQFEGKTIDAFLAGVGTGGTLSGVGKVLKKEYPNIEIVAIEPEASPVLYHFLL